MSATIELLERYKTSLGIQADRVAGQMLGVKSQTISNWRTRGSQAEPWLIEKMCLAVNEDVGPWLLRTQIEQTATVTNQAVWRRVAAKLGYTVVGCAAVAQLPLRWLERQDEMPWGGLFDVALAIQECAPQTFIA